MHEIVALMLPRKQNVHIWKFGGSVGTNDFYGTSLSMTKTMLIFRVRYVFNPYKYNFSF